MADSTVQVRMPDGTLVDMPANPTPQQFEQMRQLIPSATAGRPIPKGVTQREIGRVLDQSGRGGLVGLFGMLPDAIIGAGDWLAQKTGYPKGIKPRPGPDTLEMWPSEAMAEMTGGPISQPQTAVGRHAGAAGMGIMGGMLMPGSMAAPVRTALVGAGAGEGSELAADAFGDNLLSRAGGSIAGGLLGGVAGMAKTNRALLAREALADVNPADLDTAVSRMRAQQEAGLPEVNVSQAMPAASNLDAYAEALANSPHGGELASQLRRQPAQAVQAGQDTLSTVPGEVLPNQVMANEMQEGATKAIGWGFNKAREEWQKLAPKDKVELPERAIASFDRQLDVMAKMYPNTSQAELIQDVRAALKNPEYVEDSGGAIVDASGRQMIEPTQSGLYLTDALQLKGAIDNALEGKGARRLNTSGLDAKDQRIAQEIRAMFSKEGGLLEQHAPQLVAANHAYERVMKEYVDSMKKSVTGNMAGRAGAVNDVNAPQGKLFALFDKGTARVPGQAERSEILTLASDLTRAGQGEVFVNAGKTWIADRFAKALGPGTASGRDPEDFAANLLKAFGDPQTLARRPSAQAQGLNDILAGMAKAQGLAPEAIPQYVRGFRRFMENITMLARRPQSVGGTNPQAINELAESGLTRNLGQVSIMTPLRQPALHWANFLKQDSLSEVSRLMTTPEGVETLRILGRSQPNSQAAITAMATFLGGAPVAAQNTGN